MVCWNTWDRWQEKRSLRSSTAAGTKRLVPEVWKAAHLVPILKKGKDMTNPSSYRPISLLSCVGKLMERVITRRLTWFLETNNVFSPSQTGYPSTSQHWRSACTPRSRHWKLLPREAKTASSLFRPVKGVRQGVEKSTAVETAESRSFRSNVQMDQQLSLPQSGQSEAWWIAQQRDQAKWGSPAKKRPLTNTIPSVRKWHCQHPPT